MTQPEKKSLTYWKQAENGLISHVYEHIASTYITEYASSRGYYFIADFDHWAKTYGTMLYLDFNTYSHEVHHLLQEAFSEFQKDSITHEKALNAARQVASEYERPLMFLEESFIKKLQELHNLPWVDIDEFTVELASEETSVNTVFHSSGIRYGRRTPKSFNTLTLHFEIHKKAYENNPAMKGLAVLVTQLIALNVHAFLNNNYVYYDKGDEWDWAAEIVAYRTYLSFSTKSLPSTKDVQKRINKYVNSLASSPLPDRLEYLIQNNYRDASARYFSMESLNKITGGVILGYGGWKLVGERTEIERVLNNSTVKVMS